MIIELSNVRKKKINKTTKCDKSTVKCDVRTAQCEDRTVKCEKKIRKPPNVTIAITYPQKKRGTVELPIVII